jgi:hypothetical protein
VLDVVDGLVDERRDVIVVELVDDVAATAHADDQAEVTEDAELLRDGRLGHPHLARELADARRARAQAPQDQHAARRRERLHRGGNVPGRGCIDGAGYRLALNAVCHERKG